MADFLDVARKMGHTGVCGPTVRWGRCAGLKEGGWVAWMGEQRSGSRVVVRWVGVAVRTHKVVDSIHIR